MKLYITTIPAHFVRFVTRAQRVKFDALAADDSGREKNKNKTKTRVKFDALAAGRFRHHVVTAEGKTKQKIKQSKQQ